MSMKQSLKRGEKILFGIFGIFLLVAILGYIAMETLRLRSEKPLYTITTHYDFSAEGAKGSVLFRKSGCTSCHRAMRNGTNMGLDLDGIGSSKTKEWLLAFLRDPERNYPTRTVDHGMAPKQAAYVSDMPLADLQSIVVFLSELTADRGSPAAERPPEGPSAFIDDMVKMWAPPDWKNKYRDIRTEDKTLEGKKSE